MTRVAPTLVRALLLAAPVVHVSSCRGGADAETTASAAAKPIGVAECGACGMVVREQPAPRAQLVHRDGTREHFCSIADMVHYARAPSPHGKPVAVFVEDLDGTRNLDAVGTAPRPWIPADAASFVVGVERGGIMGVPVLTYGSHAAAEQASRRYGGSVHDFAGLSQQVLQLEQASTHTP